MGFWQPVEWRLKSREATVKGNPSAPLSTCSTLRGFVPGPSQLQCLPKCLDTVVQLALLAP